jgi:DNA N-6-adenine-methyltransferase (Dam)
MPKADGTRGRITSSPRDESGRTAPSGSGPKPPGLPPEVSLVPSPPTLHELGISKTQSSKWQKLAALPEQAFEEKVDKAKSKAEDSTTSAPRHHKAEYTGEVEWYTPPEYIALARMVLGDFDVDPATSVLAQETVRACDFYTVEDNGLAQEWNGRVWLNPPYAQPYITDFMNKMVAEFTAGNVTEAIMLTHNYTDTAWFHTGVSGALLAEIPRATGGEYGGREKKLDGSRSEPSNQHLTAPTRLVPLRPLPGQGWGRDQTSAAASRLRRLDGGERHARGPPMARAARLRQRGCARTPRSGRIGRSWRECPHGQWKEVPDRTTFTLAGFDLCER